MVGFNHLIVGRDACDVTSDREVKNSGHMNAQLKTTFPRLPLACDWLLANGMLAASSYGLKRQGGWQPLPPFPSWCGDVLTLCPPYTVRWKCCVVNAEATS